MRKPSLHASELLDLIADRQLLVLPVRRRIRLRVRLRGTVRGRVRGRGTVRVWVRVTWRPPPSCVLG